MITRRLLTNSKFQTSTASSVVALRNQRTFHKSSSPQFFSFFNRKPKDAFTVMIEQQKKIDNELSKGNLSSIQDMLEQNQTSDPKLQCYWNFFKHKTLARTNFLQLNNPEALEHCNSALELESDLKANNLYDQVFLMFCQVIRLKSEILFEQMSQETLDLQSDLVDRVRNKLSSEKNEAKAKILYDNLALDLYMRAKILTSLNRLSDALLDIDEAISLDPNATRYKILKADIHFRRSDFEEADEQAEQIMAMTKDVQIQDESTKIFAKVRAAKHEYEDAISYIDEIEYPDASMYVLSAECKSNLHRFEEVVEDCRKAESMDPTLIFSVVDLHATALNRLARYDELISYSRYIAHLIKDLDLPEEIVQSAKLVILIAELDKLCWDGQYEQALETILKEMPMVTQDTYNDLATSLIERKTEILLLCGDNKRALESAEEYVQLVSGKDWADEVDSLELRALARARLGNLTDAYEDLSRAEQLIAKSEVPNHNLLEETYSNHKYTRARVMSLEPEKKEEALKLFGDALDFVTEFQLHDLRLPILVDLAQLEIEVGRAKEAKKHIQEILKYKPDHPLGQHK